MTQPVIDTLRLADRLKESGFEDRQAEGLARALGSEISEHLATKADLDAGIQLVRGDYRALGEKLDSRFETSGQKIDARFEASDQRIDARSDASDQKVDARFETSDQKVDSRFSAVDARFDALDEKFEARFNALSTQIKFIFAMLGVLIALGLVETVLPLLA